MTQIVTTEFAEPGTRFAPDCFDSQIGKDIPFRMGGDVLTCSLLGASVSENGDFATLTLAVPSDLFEVDTRGFSLKGDQE